jgi:hypothetical protein
MLDDSPENKPATPTRTMISHLYLFEKTLYGSSGASSGTAVATDLGFSLSDMLGFVNRASQLARACLSLNGFWPLTSEPVEKDGADWLLTRQDLPGSSGGSCEHRREGRRVEMVQLAS